MCVQLALAVVAATAGLELVPAVVLAVVLAVATTWW